MPAHVPCLRIAGSLSHSLYRRGTRKRECCAAQPLPRRAASLTVRPPRPRTCAPASRGCVATTRQSFCHLCRGDESRRPCVLACAADVLPELTTLWRPPAWSCTERASRAVARSSTVCLARGASGRERSSTATAAAGAGGPRGPAPAPRSGGRTRRSRRPGAPSCAASNSLVGARDEVARLGAQRRRRAVPPAAVPPVPPPSVPPDALPRSKLCAEGGGERLAERRLHGHDLLGVAVAAGRAPARGRRRSRA